MFVPDQSSAPAQDLGGSDDINVDQLLSEIDAGSGAPEIPMTAGDAPTTPEEPTPTQASAPAPAPAAQDFEFTWNGKQIKAPITDPRIKQWASQGYDYAQKIAEFNKQKQDFEPLAKRFGEVDAYIKENPEWWNHVQQAWETREQQAAPQVDPNNPFAQELHKIKSEFTELKQFKDQTLTERQQQIAQQEDQALEGEIKSIQEKYPDLDLSAVDESGKTLEFRVLDHAMKNGIKSFRAAFLDLNHEDLLKRAEERGKSAVTKDIQAKKKAGLLGTTSTPTKGVQDAQNHRNKSYDQLMHEALEEIRGA